MKSINLARQAIDLITNQVPERSLSYTTYCAMVIRLADGKRAVLIATAGATASGIPGPLLTQIENTLNEAVIGCAAPIPGQGTWHMNDAEQQALAIWREGYPTSTIKAVKATRDICESCCVTLRQLGLDIQGSEATAP